MSKLFCAEFLPHLLKGIKCLWRNMETWLEIYIYIYFKFFTFSSFLIFLWKYNWQIRISWNYNSSLPHDYKGNACSLLENWEQYRKHEEENQSPVTLLLGEGRCLCFSVHSVSPRSGEDMRFDLVTFTRVPGFIYSVMFNTFWVDPLKSLQTPEHISSHFLLCQYHFWMLTSLSVKAGLRQFHVVLWFVFFMLHAFVFHIMS